MHLRRRHVVALWALWVVAVAFPVATTTTRAVTIALLVVSWGATAAIARQRWLRRAILAPSLLVAVVFVAPGRASREPVALRAAYVASLQRYAGVPYVWGGEGALGLDCSGLVRRAMVRALLVDRPAGVRDGGRFGGHGAPRRGRAHRREHHRVGAG